MYWSDLACKYWRYLSVCLSLLPVPVADPAGDPEATMAGPAEVEGNDRERQEIVLVRTTFPRRPSCSEELQARDWPLVGSWRYLVGRERNQFGGIDVIASFLACRHLTNGASVNIAEDDGSSCLDSDVAASWRNRSGYSEPTEIQHEPSSSS